MRIPVQVLVYPVRFLENKWEYLLLKRTESRGGFWQGVTGHPEKSENNAQAAKRELLEETGYVPGFFIETDFSYTIKMHEKWKEDYPEGIEEIPEYVFIARIDHPDLPSIDPYEHDEWKWCTFEEAIKLLKWKENKEALEYVKSFLEEE